MSHGTEMLTALVIDELCKRGWKPILYVAHHDKRTSLWSKFLSERNVPVRHPGFWFGTERNWPHRIGALRLRRHLEIDRPSFIWASDNSMLPSLAALAVDSKIPFLFMIQVKRVRLVLTMTQFGLKHAKKLQLSLFMGSGKLFRLKNITT
ncbi:MAG: hypothetical protein QM706_00900 [Nitrospira sp.]